MKDLESKYLKALIMICLEAKIINSCFSLYFVVFRELSTISTDYFYNQWNLKTFWKKNYRSYINMKDKLRDDINWKVLNYFGS